jgi:hypothetical protein
MLSSLSLALFILSELSKAHKLMGNDGFFANSVDDKVIVLYSGCHSGGTLLWVLQV